MDKKELDKTIALLKIRIKQCKNTETRKSLERYLKKLLTEKSLFE